MRFSMIFLSAFTLCFSLSQRAWGSGETPLPPDTVYVVRVVDGSLSGRSAAAAAAATSRETFVTEPARRTFRFYFARERSEFDRHRPVNASELERMDNFFQSTRPGDTVVAIRRVTVTGYCSVEGIFYNNEILSRRRAETLRDVIRYRYQGSAFTLDTRHMGEDWSGLRRLLETTEINYRRTMLDIIDHVDVMRGRERQLMQVGGGYPYREMKQRLFPQLRRVEVDVDYERRKPVPVRQALPSVEPSTKPASSDCPDDSDRLAEERRRRKQQRREERRRRMAAFTPRLAVKSNLTEWAGLTQDFEVATYMPNLSVELFFNGQWSVCASGRYANWSYGAGGKEFYGVSAYSVEPRFWFMGNGEYYGFYVGAFGLSGDFNNQSTDAVRMENGTANCTGTYWQAGISAGYHVRFNEHWGLEIGARAGYRQAKVMTYEMPGYWYERTLRHSAFGLAGLNLSLVYRIGW